MVRIFIGLFVALTLVGPAHAGKKKNRAAEIESRVLWEHEFPGTLHSLELMDEGHLNAVARTGKKKKSPRRRYLIDEKGKILWEGDAKVTRVVTDYPEPLIMELKRDAFYLSALDASGTPRWSQPLGGYPATMTAGEKAVCTVLFPKAWVVAPEKAHMAELLALEAGTGRTLWRHPIGEIILPANAAGGEITFDGDSVYFAGGGKALRVQLADGKVLWRSDLPAASGLSATWYFRGDTAYWGSGGTAASFSKSSGLIWSTKVRETGTTLGLEEDSGGVVAVFAGAKGITLALLGKEDGRVQWTKELRHRTKKFGRPPPAGIALSKNAVFVAADGAVLGFELATGQEIHKHKIKKKWFQGLKTLRPGDGRFSLVGTNVVLSRSLEDGSELWTKAKYQDPTSHKRKSKQMAVGLMGLSMSMLASSSEASRLRSKAGEKRYGSSSYSSLMSEAARLDSQAKPGRLITR